MWYNTRMERITTKSYTVDYWDSKGNHLLTSAYCNNTKSSIDTEEYADKNRPMRNCIWQVAEMKQED